MPARCDVIMKSGAALLRHKLRFLLTFALSFAVADAVVAQPKPLAELPLIEEAGPYRNPQIQWMGFSPDGKWLALRFRVSDTVARIRVWTRSEWKVADSDFDCTANSSVKSACVFDAQEPVLYLAANGKMHAFHLPLKEKPKAVQFSWGLNFGRAIQAVEMAADNKRLRISTYTDNILRIDLCPKSDVASIEKVFEQRLGSVTCAPAISSDGKLLVVGTTVRRSENSDHGLEIWSVDSKKQLVRIGGLNDDITVVRFAPGEQSVVAGGADGTFRVHEVKSGRLVRTLTERYTVSTVDFHPTRQYLAFGTYDREGEPNVRVVDIPSGRILASLAADIHGISQVRFSPDGKQLATTGSERLVRIWDLEALGVK
jgi:WD40 repeat protein